MRHIFIGLLVLVASFVISEEKKESKEEPKVPLSNEAADWMERYHSNPAPEKFVKYMKQWAKEGTLQNHQAQPALIGFVSQLMRQNRDQILPWAEELNDLGAEDLVVFNTALVFSRTGEADKLIRMALGAKYDEFERPPKILELSLNEPTTMNMLWGFFYATGSEAALRKIILGFKYELAPLDPEGVEIPEGYQPYYTQLPDISFASLSHNLIKQPEISEICEKIYSEDKSLTEPEKRNLYDLLSMHDENKYPPRKEVAAKKKAK